jgi:hypothetical protein
MYTWGEPKDPDLSDFYPSNTAYLSNCSNGSLV